MVPVGRLPLPEPLALATLFHVRSSDPELAVATILGDVTFRQGSSFVVPWFVRDLGLDLDGLPQRPGQALWGHVRNAEVFFKVHSRRPGLLALHVFSTFSIDRRFHQACLEFRLAAISHFVLDLDQDHRLQSRYHRVWTRWTLSFFRSMPCGFRVPCTSSQSYVFDFPRCSLSIPLIKNSARSQARSRRRRFRMPRSCTDSHRVVHRPLRWQEPPTESALRRRR